MNANRIAYVLPFKEACATQAENLPGKPKSLVVALTNDQARIIMDRIKITTDYPEITNFNMWNEGIVEAMAIVYPKKWVQILSKYIAFSDEYEKRNFFYSSSRFDSFRALDSLYTKVQLMICPVGFGFSVDGCATEKIDIFELRKVFDLDR